MTLNILKLKDTCTGCGACVSICPKQALSLEYNDEGFYYPHLNPDKCIDCKLCEKACHVLNNPTPATPSKKYQAYMIKAKDKNIVKNSSSGGAFSLLANEVLQLGGVVYGARYNFAKERLEHCSTDVCTLNELRKSKYIESYMGNTCKEIAVHLKNNRKVLFCGTPCQVEGVHHYLSARKIDTSNLLLVRFVCHGVPANLFFTEYKHYEEKKYKSKMISFDFRPKTRGWRNSDWIMKFSNGKEENGPYNYYYYYFQLSNLLRSSCYSCKRVFHEIADFTIADFWGIHTYQPENKDQEGISLLLSHSEKSNAIIKRIKEFSICEQIPYSALDYIYREAEDRESAKTDRNNIMECVKQKGYMYVAKKTLRKQILKNKSKAYVSKRLKPILKWIRKK